MAAPELMGIYSTQDKGLIHTDHQIMQNYFNNNRAMSHHGTSQGGHGGMSRLDILPNNISPNQYSAITVKWDGSQNQISKQNDYAYQ